MKGLCPLLGNVVLHYQKAFRLVGEERNIAHIFLSAVTRHLKPQYRRHVIPQGEWGVGKSTVLKKVLRPFWSDVELYTRLTGPGLDRRQESFDGKILLIEQFLEREPVELSFLMTEGELSILVAERDPKTGQIISTNHHVRGMPVVVSTLTGARIGPQLLSRISMPKMDESEDQTRRIVRSKLEQRARVFREDPSTLYWPITWVDAKCRELGPYVAEVKMPFAEKLEQGIPPVLSMRRGVDKILNLVDAIAFVKAAVGLRPIVEMMNLPEGVKEAYVIALPEDVEDAVFCLGQEQLVDYARYFFGRSREIYDFLRIQTEARIAKDVAVALKLSQNRAREYLNTLVDLGHVTRSKTGREWFYEAIPGSEPRVELKAEFSEQELEAWFNENFPLGSARLLLPEKNATPSIVTVVSSVEPEIGTVKQIVPETATNPSTVPNLNQDDYTTVTTKQNTADASDTSHGDGDSSEFKPQRVDIPLLRDYLLNKAVPLEEKHRSYGAEENLRYLAGQRFGSAWEPYVPGVLVSLRQEGLLIEHPWPKCWKRVNG